MPVLALQGLRGGMGTTSVTAALAWALQQLGESVLAIDFTPDNLLRLHFNTPFELARGWARAEQDGGAWQEGALRYCETSTFCLWPPEWGGKAGSAAPVSSTAGTLARQPAPTDRRRSAALDPAGCPGRGRRVGAAGAAACRQRVRAVEP